MKFFDYGITFREMPFSSSGSLTFFTGGPCKYNCKGCSWGEEKPEGEELPVDVFSGIVKKKRKHTHSVCFLGESMDYRDLIPYIKEAKKYGMEVMLYTGGELDEFDKSFLDILDYIKVGPWKGVGLYDKGTNQRVYKLHDGVIDKEIKFYEM